MKGKSKDKETLNALARHKGEPLPFPEIDPEIRAGKIGQQERIELNKIARANSEPLPWPEVEWTLEDEKIVKAAVKKFTSNFRSLPRGYDREDMIQEGRVKWSKVREQHIGELSEKKTFCFNVIQNEIRDLVKAGNRDKRKIEQFTLELKEEITTEDGLVYNPKKSIPKIEYDGAAGLNYNPVPRGTPQNIRLRAESEPEKYK